MSTTTTENMNDTTDNTITMLPVSTVEPAEVPAGFILIAARQRSSKERTVEASQRFRGILVPEAAILPPMEACHSKFRSILVHQIQKLAEKKLAAAWKDGDPKAVQAAAYTLDSVLAYFAEQKQRASVDGAAITAWLNAGTTLATLNEAQRKTWLAKLPKMASPGYKGILTAEQAATVAQRITDEDAAHPVGTFLMQRLAAIMEATSTADAF